MKRFGPGRIGCALPNVVHFENTKSAKLHLVFFSFLGLHPVRPLQPQKLKKSAAFAADFEFICDPGRIRTPNPQSRNLIFYPVELLGHYYYS